MQKYRTAIQNNRVSVIASVIKNIYELSVIEIEAQALPTFYKDELKIEYCDYETKEQSQKKFLHNEKLFNNVQKPDYIVTSDNYASFLDKKFDVCIANHVIEHTNNVILWLQSISEILSHDGYLFLAIPDKKYTFDKYRQTTQLSHIIADYYNGASVVEHIIEIALLYDQEFIGKEINIAKNLSTEILDQEAKKSAWIGLHRHVFDLYTFQHQIIIPLLYAGFCDFRVIFCSEENQPGNEFHCILQKGKEMNFDQNKFLSREQHKKFCKKITDDIKENKILNFFKSIFR
jgi:SAM-dependent methyltransferase